MYMKTSMKASPQNWVWSTDWLSRSLHTLCWPSFGTCYIRRASHFIRKRYNSIRAFYVIYILCHGLSFSWFLSTVCVEKTVRSYSLSYKQAYTSSTGLICGLHGKFAKFRFCPNDSHDGLCKPWILDSKVSYLYTFDTWVLSMCFRLLTTCFWNVITMNIFSVHYMKTFLRDIQITSFCWHCLVWRFLKGLVSNDNFVFVCKKCHSRTISMKRKDTVNDDSVKLFVTCSFRDLHSSLMFTILWVTLSF